MSEKDLVLGYDFGTSSVKAALITYNGTVVASGSAVYPLLLPNRGWAEQRPEDWWTAMVAVTHNLLQDTRYPASRIAAIGMSAQMCGVVPVDAGGVALNNCLIWMDMRSADIARNMMGGMIKIAGYGPLKLARWLRLTGGAPNLSGKDPISKIVWLRRNRPDIWPKIHKLLDVKDYLLHRCTGRFATTYDCAHLTWLFDARKKRKQWAPELLRQIDLDKSLLPDVLRATDVAGGLTSTAAQALGLDVGTPVAAGLGDVSAAAAGAGNPEQGSLHFYLGTSAWFGSILKKSRVDPFTSIGSICCADGLDYLLIATQENAGASVRWGMEALGFGADDFSTFEAAAARSKLRSTSAMFFPWLSGERVPVDDEHVRGGFANLSIDSRRGDVAFALYEGVALNARWAMRPFDRLSGRPGETLRIVGGGARSRFWSQMFADILQRDVERVRSPELCGALGSAMAAAVAAGWYNNLTAAAGMALPAETLSPDLNLSDLYSERFEKFAGYYRRMRPWYADGSTVDREPVLSERVADD